MELVGGLDVAVMDIHLLRTADADFIDIVPGLGADGLILSIRFQHIAALVARFEIDTVVLVLREVVA